jgi:hypothetical protein
VPLYLYPRHIFEDEHRFVAQVSRLRADVRRDALHRIAPGYNPTSLLVPKSVKSGGQALAVSQNSAPASAKAEPKPMSDMDMLGSLNDGQMEMNQQGGMDDLTRQLEQLDGR